MLTLEEQRAATSQGLSFFFNQRTLNAPRQVQGSGFLDVDWPDNGNRHTASGRSSEFQRQLKRVFGPHIVRNALPSLKTSRGPLNFSPALGTPPHSRPPLPHRLRRRPSLHIPLNPSVKTLRPTLPNSRAPPAPASSQRRDVSGQAR